MAIWQYTFFVIPRDNYIGLMKNKDEDTYDFLSWRGYYLKDPSIELISSVLKPSESWSDSIKQFGLIDQSCVQLYYENNVIVEVSVRIDIRNITHELFDVILEFIVLNNAIIYTCDDYLVEPTYEDLIKDIKKSNSYIFCKNPISFLKKLETKDDKNLM